MYRLNEVFDVAHHRLKVKKRDNVLHAPTKLISRIICIAATKEFVTEFVQEKKVWPVNDMTGSFSAVFDN